MIRKLLVSISLLVGLAGCNLPGAPGEGMTPALTEDVQNNGQTAEETRVGASIPNEIVPVPVNSIQIEGVPYLAYQIPGDPFRIVCQEPCSLDLQYIYAEYAGFRLAHAMLIQLTGIDTLAELQPVDMHLDVHDSVCGELPAGHAYIYSSMHQAYTCSDGPGLYPTLEEMIQKAALLESQYFPLHEYMHTIFFGRISGHAGDFYDPYAWFFHDFVVPLPSFAIGIMDPAGFCSYRNEYPSGGDYPLWLISELCQQNGFQLEDVARSLIELDALCQSGGGQVYEEGYAHLVPSVAQYRDILNGLLGSDTTNAFAEACWPPELFGNSFSSPASCPSNSPTGTGTATPVK
ncbi:MAG: hypothetical protein AB1531_06060 [Chloroflexota bacterium]